MFVIKTHKAMKKDVFKGTGGKWYCEDMGSIKGYYLLSDANVETGHWGNWIGSVHNSAYINGNEEELKANALLLAGSKDLLFSLIKLVEAVEKDERTDSTEINRAMAWAKRSIRKALNGKIKK